MILAVLGGSFLEPDPLSYLFGAGIGTNIGASILWGLVAGFIGYLIARRLRGAWAHLHARLDSLHARHAVHAASLQELHRKLDALHPAHPLSDTHRSPLPNRRNP